MPKPFTDNEREAIRIRLLDAAEQCWGRYGIKKTTVDDLASLAGISKGSFYLFYESKELLFLDVIERIERRIKEAVFEALAARSRTSKEVFIDAVDKAFAAVSRTPWLLSLQQGDYEVLTRRMPEDRVARHIHSDEDDVRRMLSILGVEPRHDVKVIAGALRAVFLILLHKTEIGEENIAPVYSLLLEGLAHEIFREEQI